MTRTPWIVLAALAAGCGNSHVDAELKTDVPNQGFTLAAADDTEVHVELVPGSGTVKGAVLMFHQAGSNLHEYDPIAEKVAGYGWDCLKVDQRSGGDMWEFENLTASQFDGQQDYLEAYQDLEAALAWAESEAYDKVLVWGSSYSASLVLKLASEHETIDGVLSFSPGEYFQEEGLVAGWNSEIDVPCFFAATSGEMQSGVYEIYDSKDEEAVADDMMVGDKDGVHGSSTLRSDRNETESSLEFYWDGVERFFKHIESNGMAFGG